LCDYSRRDTLDSSAIGRLRAWQAGMARLGSG